MIKAIVFDIGGIVIDESSSKSRKILAEKFGFSEKDFSDFSKKYVGRSFKGWHYTEFFAQLIKELNLKNSPQELYDGWLKVRNQTSEINKKVRNLILKLKQGYKVVCFTNTTILNDKSNARQETYKLFDIVIKSTKTGTMKPEKEIYSILVKKLNELGIKPEEAVFIDNKEEYLAPAKGLGIKTILFDKYYKLVLELNKFGVYA